MTSSKVTAALTAIERCGGVVQAQNPYSGVRLQAAEADRLFTEVSLGLRWGCTTKKLQADRLNGRGVPFVKLGRLVRYRLSDILAYEEAAVRHSTSEAAK